MIKLYFYILLCVIFVLPTLLIINISELANYICFGLEFIGVYCLAIFMKKTQREISEPTRNGFIKSVIFNVFASKKEKELISRSEWVKYVVIKKNQITIDENLDNK